MTQVKFTQAQLDAIGKAKRERFNGAKEEKLAAAAIAARLQAEGHEAWKPAPTTAAPTSLEDIDGMDIDPGPQPGTTTVAVPAPVVTPPAPAGVVTKIEDVRSGTAMAIVVKPEERAALAHAPAEGKHLPVAPTGAPDGLEELDSSDFVLPALTLRQAQTQDIPDGVEIPQGHWFFRQQMHVHSAKRRIVVLHVGKTRSLMLEYDKAKREPQIERILKTSGVSVPLDREKPVCFSRDRVAPVVQEDIKVLAATCKDCAFGKWRTVAGKPVMDCGEGYALLIVDRTDAGEEGFGTPAWLYLRGAAIGPTKGMLTALKIAAHGAQQPAFAFEIELGSAVEKRDRSTFFVPTFGSPIPLDEPSLITFYGQTRESALAAQDRAEVMA